MKYRFITALFISLVLLGGCASEGQQEVMTNDDSATENGPIATIKTTMGEIRIQMLPKQAPETVKNFTELSKRGFYDGLIFHRVIPDFMIQGGDPLGTGTGGETYKGKGHTLPDEFSPDLKNVRGALSMANRGPNTGTSQFFIVQAKGGTPRLDGKHTVFGKVISGMEVVDAIANVKADGQDRPVQEVKMEKVTVEM